MGSEMQETAPDCTRNAHDRFYDRIKAMYGRGGTERQKKPAAEEVALPCPPSYAAYLARLYEKRLARTNAASARRHAAKLRRTPPWADQEAIRAVYAEAARVSQETGIEHHVDHFYPLQGKKVSGLHVHTNLRVLPGVENMKKGSRYEP